MWGIQHIKIDHAAVLRQLGENHGFAGGVPQFRQAGIDAVQNGVGTRNALGHGQQSAGGVIALAPAGFIQVAQARQRADQRQATGHRHIQKPRQLRQGQRALLAGKGFDDFDDSQRRLDTHCPIQTD
ncbi:hypothetical protein D3C73_935270 [compost metagenome]